VLIGVILAHTTGLGEIALVLPVVAAIVGLLALARRRAERGDVPVVSVDQAARPAPDDAGEADEPPG